MELAFWNNPTGLIIVAVLVLLLFGGSKIPEMMRGLGTGMKEFKKGMSDTGDDELDREKREKDEQERRIRARIEEEMRREDEAKRQRVEEEMRRQDEAKRQKGLS
jgi:sec-independent protein translocase protein TatA